MKLNRRHFIKSAGGLALASVAGAIPAFSAWQQNTSSHAGAKLRAAVFFEPDFPTIDFTPISKETLVKALESYDSRFLNIADLNTELPIQNYDVFINPYGSAFPVEAWETILKYLTAGGNWLNIGGTPFTVPIAKENNKFVPQVKQTEYHKILGITQSFLVQKNHKTTYSANTEIAGSDELVKEFKAEQFFELYVRFSNYKEYPDEDGSTGPKEAVLHPLISAVDEENHVYAAPIIQIDRLEKKYAGGRWALANFNGTISSKGIQKLVEIAAGGSLEFIVQPTFACYHAGETPSFSVGLRRPAGNASSVVKGKCDIVVVDADNSTVGRATTQLSGEGRVIAGSAPLNPENNKKLSPGYYEAHCSLLIENLAAKKTVPLHYTTGFWVNDPALLSGGKPITIDKNYFLRDGEPYPITGTTYMASDVHRKFLLEPNPAVWHKDFADMKEAGINMIRTGIWTGWKNYMSTEGEPNESALRAMDAFLLTARQYDIPVIFTFFAFIPESWGGINAYLDPKSIESQKKFITMFTKRYAMVNDILWDLINEPSFCNPKHLWSTRPNYDPFEIAAWNAWLKKSNADLNEQYRLRADEEVTLPSGDDFDNVNIFNDRRPIKVIDYRLFAQEMFANWIKEMTSAIRLNGSPHQLITVGQDEGGTGDRPNPQFFADAVDFTCIHNWWFNDDLVWDNVVTKTPGKPNLVEETGVMFYEKMDSSVWRTEEEARNLLERKLAISMGASGAGFIEWIWNTNPYMDSDNEAAIGLLRVDGSEKPELQPVREFAKFYAEHKKLMVNQEAEKVLLVFPHSQMFSVRNFATEATQKSIRTMYYHLHTQMSAISEYALESIKTEPKLILLPSPRIFNQKSWDILFKKVSAGSTLLITGPFDADEHWLPTNRTKKIGIDSSIEPVMNQESLYIDNVHHIVNYRGDKLQRIEKAVIDETGDSKVITMQHGKGAIVWSPLPVEVSDSPDAITALYKYALQQADVRPIFSAKEIDPSILILPTVFENAVLYVVISETDRDVDLPFTHLETNTELSIHLPRQRTVSLFINRKDGKVIGKMG
ncbi:MAG: cellulase family glycosylhydrolase [Bacteroidota bacterium]